MPQRPPQHRALSVTGLLGASVVTCALLAAAMTVWIHAWGQWHDGPARLSSSTHVMPEGDFSLLWSAGRMAADGHAAGVYDGSKLLEWRRHAFGPGFRRLDWMYPPPVLALGVAVSRFPLLPGYFLWDLLICAVSLWVLRGAGLPWRVVLPGFFGPPTWTCLVLGQHAPLVGAFVVGGLLRARQAPVRAGMQVALATFKPHLGVLVPLVWLAQRRWPAFAVAAAGTLLLAAVGTVLLGPGIWPAFLHGTGESGQALLGKYFAHGYPIWAASVFWMMRSFDAPAGAAYAVQGITALMVVAAVWVAARRGDGVAVAGFAACLMPLVSPYLYSFDLTGYSLAIAIYAGRRGWTVPLVLLWLCPGLSEAFTYFTERAVLPVFIVLAAALLWRDVGRSTADAPTAALA